MAVEDWQIDRFDGTMIRFKNEGNMLVLQAQPGGAYDFEEFEEGGEHSLIWDGDVVRLIITKYEEDGNVKMEFTQRSNGLPIAMFNRLHSGFFDEIKAYADRQQLEASEIEAPADRPSAAPAAGGKRSNVKSRSQRASRSSRRRSRKA